MASQVPQAAFGGAVSGASAGAPLGPWGMGIGAGIGAISGMFQGQRANKLQSQYEKAEAALQPVRPEEYAYLNRVRQQERNFLAGTDPAAAFSAMGARNVGAQTQRNIVRAGGPGVIGNLLRAQAGTNQGIAQIGANSASQAMSLMGLQGTLMRDLSTREYARQRELRNQAMERSVAAQQNIQNMFSGALAMLPSMTGGFGGGAKGAAKASPVAPMAGQTYNPGGMIGSTYVPGVNTGVNYGGLGTGVQTPPINYGLPR